jgi:hypothetical protein
MIYVPILVNISQSCFNVERCGHEKIYANDLLAHDFMCHVLVIISLQVLMLSGMEHEKDFSPIKVYAIV